MKRVYSIFALILLVLTLTTLVNASYIANGVSWIAPTTGGKITGTANLTVYNVTTKFDELLNCTFYAKSASTANSSWTAIGTAVNDTLFRVNVTYATAPLEDSNDYMLNATCRNSTNSIADAVITGVIIDNTLPKVPYSGYPATGTNYQNGSASFSISVNGNETTGCTLYFRQMNPGSSSYTMTHTGNTCTYSLSSISEQTYTWYVTASDGLNTTDSADYVLVFTGSGGNNLPPEIVGNSATATGSDTTEDSGVPTWIWIVGGLVLLVVVIKVLNR